MVEYRCRVYLIYVLIYIHYHQVITFLTNWIMSSFVTVYKSTRWIAWGRDGTRQETSTKWNIIQFDMGSGHKQDDHLRLQQLLTSYHMIPAQNKQNSLKPNITSSTLLPLDHFCKKMDLREQGHVIKH